jgi:hypothetical protein
MLPQTPRRSGLFSSTGRGLQYLVGGCSVLLATVSIVIGVEVSVATASSATAPSVEIINRAQKGDRLPLVPALHQNPVSRPAEASLPRILAPDQALADGCSLIRHWGKSQAAACPRRRDFISVGGAMIGWLARRRGRVRPRPTGASRT